MADIFERTYQAARRDAEDLVGRQLPQKSEWTLAQGGDETFYPQPGHRSVVT
jgi:hypothetical protein